MREDQFGNRLARLKSIAWLKLGPEYLASLSIENHHQPNTAFALHKESSANQSRDGEIGSGCFATDVNAGSICPLPRTPSDRVFSKLGLVTRGLTKSDRPSGAFPTTADVP